MTPDPVEKFLKAVNEGVGLRDEFVYYMDFEDYKSFPDPFPRTTFTAADVQETIYRYPDPQKPGTEFRWDIHGRLLTPARPSLGNVAVVMIHGGAANECEFLFTPDGREEFLDLTKETPAGSRAGIAQHIASLGVKVLAISLPGHYSTRPWPPIAERKPEFVIGETHGDTEMKNRLGVYTFRMCLEAIKALIEKSLPTENLYVWGHSTGCEHFYLLEQYGLRNKIIGGLGFGTGMPAWLRKEWALAADQELLGERERTLRPISGMSLRSPEAYVKTGYVGDNQPWGSAEKWFALENHRRPQFKPFLHDIEHHGLVELREEVRRTSGLPDDELFITFKGDLNRLSGKRLLYMVGECDTSHWVENADKGIEYRLQYFAAQRYVKYADKFRLVVIPRLTHYGHIESHNESLANLMVTGLKQYFPTDSHE